MLQANQAGVRARARACARACACVRASVRACVYACMCVCGQDPAGLAQPIDERDRTVGVNVWRDWQPLGGDVKASPTHTLYAHKHARIHTHTLIK